MKAEFLNPTSVEHAKELRLKVVRRYRELVWNVGDREWVIADLAAELGEQDDALGMAVVLVRAMQQWEPNGTLRILSALIQSTLGKKNFATSAAGRALEEVLRVQEGGRS